LSLIIQNHGKEIHAKLGAVLSTPNDEKLVTTPNDEKYSVIV